jgi:hypothetical protein
MLNYALEVFLEVEDFRGLPLKSKTVIICTASFLHSSLKINLQIELLVVGFSNNFQTRHFYIVSLRINL